MEILVEEEQMTDICSYCEKPAARFELTGVKTFTNEIQVPYQLCPECCKQVQCLSAYTPSEVQKRRDFWESLWAHISKDD